MSEKIPRSPEDDYTHEIVRARQEFIESNNQQMMKNVIDAMPSPAQTAFANAWGQIDADIQDFFKSMYGGKMGGGMGGMGGGGAGPGARASSGGTVGAPSYLRYYDSTGETTRQTWNY